MLNWVKATVLAVTCSFIVTAYANELVEKQIFEMPSYQTVGGKTIQNVRVGWEAYGELNDAKDNVILITHFFSGNSHAAGTYSENDPQPGYWDAIIGPDKAIDTNRYYVISSDTLVNQNPYAPNVVTTGPASINPETNEPYGLDFPVVTIRDFVNVQRALLDSLGIEKLHAVVGASMGSLQALEWSVAYPDDVERMVSVIGAGAMDPWTVMSLEQWARPIKNDPNWNHGNYYDGEPPKTGVTHAIAMITQQAMHPKIINQLAPPTPILDDQGMASVTNELPPTAWLFQASAARAQIADANHILYLVRANQLFVAGHSGGLAEAMKDVKAKTLFMPATHDLLLQPYLAQQAVRALEAAGKKPQYEEIEGNWGHLDGIYSIASQADTLAKFLNDD